ncbi:hypothetical protein CRE_21248 [Caenorhabditis remanei]|uniref:G-protein coupled receptors family 1 profile domain-containing protein n=1 Tax=Caenorhabditis remanei TaxID=31234 RepID=E3MF38_CAERE|nr:hypothetical protein CRE_21248 [Caenorhabditis remanei]
MLLLISQILFSLLVLLLLFYDVTLLIVTVKKRLKDIPVVYIICTTFCGIVNKISHILLVDGYVISNQIGGDEGYEEYRRFFGKQLSLIVTWGYLTPIYFNWLMTIHRVGVVVAPMKVWIFSEPKLMGYCIGIMVILSFIDMLIPYFSSCSINFHAHPATWISACAPDRHLLTWFQNKYIIYFPVTAMLVNLLLIMYMKITRGITNDKAMIRQVAATAIYLSIYEIGSLYIRLLPEYFDVMSSEFKDIFYFIRILTICSLNFFVYFVITRVTRQLVLEFLGFSKKKRAVATITVTMT